MKMCSKGFNQAFPFAAFRKSPLGGFAMARSKLHGHILSHFHSPRCVCVCVTSQEPAGSSCALCAAQFTAVAWLADTKVMLVVLYGACDALIFDKQFFHDVYISHWLKMCPDTHKSPELNFTCDVAVPLSSLPTMAMLQVVTTLSGLLIASEADIET